MGFVVVTSRRRTVLWTQVAAALYVIVILCFIILFRRIISKTQQFFHELSHKERKFRGDLANDLYKLTLIVNLKRIYFILIDSFFLRLLISYQHDISCFFVDKIEKKNYNLILH